MQIPEKNIMPCNYVNNDECCTTSTKAYWGNTNSVSFTTTTGTAVPDTISWNPATLLPPLYVSNTEMMTRKDAEKYEDTIDRHLEEFEEDLHFFNEKREEQGELIELLEAKINEQRCDIGALKTEIVNLKTSIDYLNAKVMELEDKIYNEMS